MAVENTDGQTEENGLSAGVSRLRRRCLSVGVPGEEGPDGRNHYPSYDAGCYRGRPESCCAYCYVRLVSAIF